MSGYYSAETKPIDLAHSKFDLSFTKQFDADLGVLYPVLMQECVPSDVMEVSNHSIMRFQSLINPVLQDINAYVHYFFVPYRILMNHKEWETFITRGKNGDGKLNGVTVTLPRWNPTTDTGTDSNTGLPIGSAVGSLWDYIGYPTGLKNMAHAPLDFGRRAYNRIYNYFYRNLDLQNEVPDSNESLLFRNVGQDYFTNAKPWLTRGGIAPTLDLKALVPVQYAESASSPNSFFATTNLSNTLLAGTAVSNRAGSANGVAGELVTSGGSYTGAKPLYVNLSNGSAVGMSDLRYLSALQTWLERNARTNGCRYDDFLKVHYGTDINMDLLEEPTYIGGSSASVVVQEVTNTNGATGSALGSLGGKAISVSSDYVGRYHAKEFGLLVGILSILPVSMYKQGIERQWLRTDYTDFFMSEGIGLGDQCIYKEEIYATNSSKTEHESSNPSDYVFGYQGRYDEMRSNRDVCCGTLRTSQNETWNLARKFSSEPVLNSDFISGKYYTTADGKRIYNVTSGASKACIVNFRNDIQALRPIPYFATPAKLI